MKTDTVIKAFEPESPLTLPFPVLRRLLLGAGLILLAIFVVWASKGSMAQPAPTLDTIDDGWQRYEAPTFAFSYPAGWTVQTPTEAAAAYRMAPSDADVGTHVSIATVPMETLDLSQIERMGVAHVERDVAVARHFLRIMPRTRVAGRVAVRVRFAADLISGERVEGLWVGVPQPDGQVLTFVLNVYPDAYFNGVLHTFKRFLTSITL